VRNKKQVSSNQAYDMVLKRLDMTRETENEELLEIIRSVLEEISSNGYFPLEDKIRMSKDLFNAFRKLDILQELIEDETITEIMINGTENIFYEKSGQLIQSDKRFMSVSKLEDVIQQIVATTNRYVNESSPIVDTRLEDGSRVNIVLKPVALNGPIMTIRKFPFEKVTMEQLVGWGSISQEAADFLALLVTAKYNIFVCGGTGCGKTTFLNALSDYIPEDERVITIEDNAELQIKGVKNLVSLEGRNANLEGEGAVTIRDLIKSALRMRPDRIVVGEVRGDETVDMISSAMLNGHNGSMSTGHSNSAIDMLYRLETMMMMGIDLPLPAISRQVASALDVIIHLGRIRDKSRKVLEIVEVLGVEEGKIQLQSLFRFEEEGMENGKILGTHVKVHELAFRDKLLAAGYS
jgi:pilus assembly protein CpaF